MPSNRQNRISEEAKTKDQSLIGKFLSDFETATPEERRARLTQFTSALGVQVSYIRSSEAAHGEIRRKLNTEPGVVISNHPSVLDPAIVFQALDRTDVLALVHERGVPILEPVIGATNIVPPPTNRQELQLMMERGKNHIAEGGLFLIFPSGADEILKHEPVHFKSGFRLFVAEINPETMVYSFYINPDVGKELPLAANARITPKNAVMIAPNLYVRRQHNLEVRVNEEYTQAKEWQEAANAVHGIHAQNEALTRHYLSRVGSG